MTETAQNSPFYILILIETLKNIFVLNETEINIFILSDTLIFSMILAYKRAVIARILTETLILF